MKLIITKGGEGSGFHGHSGRPGKVGGSAKRTQIHPKRADISSVYPFGMNGKVARYASVSIYSEESGEYSEWGDNLLESQISGWMSKHDPVVSTAVSKIIVCDTEEDFVERFRRDNEGILFMPKNFSTVGGYYNPDDNSIVLRNDMLREDIFHHEVGHAIQQASVYGYEWSKKFSNDSSFDRATKYSRTNHFESFAETYEAYIVTEGKALNKHTRESFDMVNRILDGI